MRFSLQLSMVFPFDATRGNHLHQLVSFMGVRSFCFFLPLNCDLYTTTLLQMLCFQLMHNNPLRQYTLWKLGRLLGMLLYSSTAHGEFCRADLQGDFCLFALFRCYYIESTS